MTKEENLAYRQRCPYDAMGDFSVFSEEKKIKNGKENAVWQPDVNIRKVKQ